MHRDRFAPGDGREDEGSVEHADPNMLSQPAGDRLLRELSFTEKEMVPT